MRMNVITTQGDSLLAGPGFATQKRLKIVNDSLKNRHVRRTQETRNRSSYDSVSPHQSPSLLKVRSIAQKIQLPATALAVVSPCSPEFGLKHLLQPTCQLAIFHHHEKNFRTTTAAPQDTFLSLIETRHFESTDEAATRASHHDIYTHGKRGNISL